MTGDGDLSRHWQITVSFFESDDFRGYILANEISCRLYFFAAIYAVTLNSCLRQLLSVTSITAYTAAKKSDFGREYKKQKLRMDNRQGSMVL